MRERHGDQPERRGDLADPDRLERREAAAQRLLWLERAWSATWPGSGIVMLFLALALTGLPALLPFPAHHALLAGFAVALVLAARAGLRRQRRSDTDEARRYLARRYLARRYLARRHLERINRLDHRPLTALRDRQALGCDDAASAALWQHHRARTAARLGRLRLGWPTPDVSRLDRHALQIAALLLLFIGLVAARGETGARLARAFTPSLPGAPAGPVSAELQIVPPAYTGRAPLFFTAGPATGSSDSEDSAGDRTDRPDRPAIPAGSRLVARVYGSPAAPVLDTGELDTGETVARFAATGDGGWRAGTTLGAPTPDQTAAAQSPESQTQTPGTHTPGTHTPGTHTPGTHTLVTIRDGRGTLLAQPLTVVPDQPPVVLFPAPPRASRRNTLQVTYQATDDYGLAGLAMLVGRDGHAPESLPLPLPDRRTGQGMAFQNLTAHPWAGLDVTLTLRATDGIGQTSDSQPVSLTLPERPFSHPVARAIVSERRVLAADPVRASDIARALEGIAGSRNLYGDDVSVFLALRVAASRLWLARTADSRQSVMSLLWDTALRVEDGRVGSAEQKLRDVQNRLREALAAGASQAELDALIHELQAALQDFFAAAAEDPRWQPEPGMAQPIRPGMEVAGEDLQRMAEQMRELNRLGARDMAGQMLNRLQQMLENLQAGIMPRGLSPQQELARDLQSLIQGQQNLLDRSFRQSQSGTPPPDGGAADAASQNQIRRALGDLMNRLGQMTGDIPGALGRAEQAMRQSGQALGQGQPGQALDPQMQALQQLQQGFRDTLQSLAGPQGQPGGVPGPFGRGPFGQGPFGRGLFGPGGQDPLGRDFAPGDSIPDLTDLPRAREILDEIRRRAANPDRPPTERDYLDRLLPQFQDRPAQGSGNPAD